MHIVFEAVQIFQKKSPEKVSFSTFGARFSSFASHRCRCERENDFRERKFGETHSIINALNSLKDGIADNCAKHLLHVLQRALRGVQPLDVFPYQDYQFQPADFFHHVHTC